MIVLSMPSTSASALWAIRSKCEHILHCNIVCKSVPEYLSVGKKMLVWLAAQCQSAWVLSEHSNHPFVSINVTNCKFCITSSFYACMCMDVNLTCFRYTRVSAKWMFSWTSWETSSFSSHLSLSAKRMGKSNLNPLWETSTSLVMPALSHQDSGQSQSFQNIPMWWFESSSEIVVALLIGVLPYADMPVTSVTKSCKGDTNQNVTEFYRFCYYFTLTEHVWDAIVFCLQLPIHYKAKYSVVGCP